MMVIIMIISFEDGILNVGLAQNGLPPMSFIPVVGLPSFETGLYFILLGM